MNTKPAVELELVQEIKIADLLDRPGGKSQEASGIHFKDGYLHIVFDSDTHILRLRPDWRPGAEGPVLLELKGKGAGYEDITYQPRAKHWYCLIEADETKSGHYKPRIDEFDESFDYVDSFWLDFLVEAENKGFEGLSCVNYAGNEYLLGLCEGNDCKGGKAGEEKGQGLVQVFKQGVRDWARVGTIKLPKTVHFKDYSSLDFRNRYATVISQVSSAMWVGRVRDAPTSLEDMFVDDGQLFVFPRDDKGRILYCNLEGVTWIGDGKLAVVSDKAKPDQHKRCASKDQSLHIFKLPGGFQNGQWGA